ncbi:hypothetical protein HAHE_22970 [Haloferula helveola]|uniref:Uncharacterized protein n=1 Tax=Haloferula helveola TaxID=490095 RepID=A0ABN6H6Z1_9BACT|nr:hypothetical protein HAHE_22970 [Haloferula helveola]
MNVSHLCLAGALFASPLFAQDSHFDGWKWKEKDTDHFFIRVEGTSYDPASRYAEKVWDVVVEVLPGLEKDFSDNLFRTPDGAKGADEAPYRHCIYLVGDGAEFNELVQIDAGRNGWDDNTVRLTKRTGNYSDPRNRYGVFCKGDPNQSAGGDRDITPVFVHSTGSTLLRARSTSNKLPFWMTAGFGYYVEHQLFELCRVYYLDFEAYYEQQNAEIQQGETLGPNESWAKVLRKLCKDGKRESLDDVCTAQILTLSPNESGYIFALTCFLVRDDAARGKYQELVKKARDGTTITKAVLLETYGYANDAALEAEWYEWLESRDFK